MQTENYKKRAIDVRRSARATLLEMRQARMSKRAAISAVDHVPPKASGPIDDAGETQDESPFVVAEQQEVAEKEDMSLPNKEVIALSETTNNDIGLSDSLDELAVKNAALVEPSDPFEAEPDEYVLEAEQAQSAGGSMQTTENWQQSELAKLPGAGPGLVWMLAQCNVETMAQLASQNAGALSSQLGVVGQILDVGQWIDFAKANS